MKKTVGRQDIIKGLHQRTSRSSVECQHILREMIALMKEKLQDGKEVKIQAFGTFYVCDAKARKGRNVRTGQEKLIPVRKTIRFRRSSILEKKLADIMTLSL